MLKGNQRVDAVALVLTLGRLKCFNQDTEERGHG
jgi:hypothetical protein